MILKKSPQVMSSPQPHGMNRYKTNQARHNQPERRPGCTHIPAGGGLTTRTLNPPPTQLHRPPRRPGHRPRQASEGPSQGQCTHVKAKTPSDEGECCARGGTRTAFQPSQTLGSHGNMRNPARSNPSKGESDAQSVDIVHTHIHSPLCSPQKPRPPQGTRFFAGLRTGSPCPGCGWRRRPRTEPAM